MVALSSYSACFCGVAAPHATAVFAWQPMIAYALLDPGAYSRHSSLRTIPKNKPRARAPQGSKHVHVSIPEERNSARPPRLVSGHHGSTALQLVMHGHVDD